MARIVIVTYGSLGDLHPALAFARELMRRGHDASCATSESYRAKITALGVPFRSIQPDFNLEDPVLVRRIMNGATGSRFLMRKLVFPRVREMHTELLSLARDADLLVTSELMCAAPLVGEQRGVRWAFLALSPISLFSDADPGLLPGPPGFIALQSLGPAARRTLRALARAASYPWWRPVRQLRRELKLPPGGPPLFEGKFSPHLNLAAFSRALQPPQPDWPQRTVQTGALFFDAARRDARLPAALQGFLDRGPAPIVFTLGSAAVHLADDFYAVSAEAARALDRRAVLLHGKAPAPTNLPASIIACDYAPYAHLLPHACAVVHQGGIGTTTETLRAGRPMLVVPFAHDQFDNAARVVRLGAGRTLARRSYRAKRVAHELAALFGEPRHAEAAARAASVVAAENGTVTAADALERLL